MRVPLRSFGRTSPCFPSIHEASRPRHGDSIIWSRSPISVTLAPLPFGKDRYWATLAQWSHSALQPSHPSALDLPSKRAPSVPITIRGHDRGLMFWHGRRPLEPLRWVDRNGSSSVKAGSRRWAPSVLTMTDLGRFLYHVDDEAFFEDLNCYSSPG